MKELDRAKGLDVQDRYSTVKTCKEFSHYMEPHEINVLSEEIIAAMYGSLLSDGSTDLSISEQEMVSFVKEGDIKVKYLRIKSVVKANAP